MAEITGKTVNMTLKTDDKLIGGVVISYGNTTIDGSVKARLEQLKADIAELSTDIKKSSAGKKYERKNLQWIYARMK